MCQQDQFLAMDFNAGVKVFCTFVSHQIRPRRAQ
jgi:hypothetical protein